MKDTKLGYVYFATSGQTDMVKIGFTIDPSARMSTLGTSTPYPFHLQSFFASYVEAEKMVHQRFSEDHIRGEWFNNSDDMQELWDDILDYQMGKITDEDGPEDVFIDLTALRIILDTIGKPWPAGFAAREYPIVSPHP